MERPLSDTHRIPLLGQLYTQMARIRAFENAAETLSQGGVSAYNKTADGSAKVRGPLHLSTGQEAVAVGVCAHLRASDYLTSTHRGHGHTLAKGADLGRMMGELYGKSNGFNGGKGGSMHIADFSVGMLGANGVVAAGLPIATGAAHAQKLLGRDDITVCFFGDGAINRGPFLESLNWAQVHQLPVLFVCEDNRWSATTASGPMIAGDGASARSQSLGIAATAVDGNDVLAVHDLAQQLVQAVRSGAGPRLLHAMTYRIKGHVSVDLAAYRDPAELAAALQNDPLANARARFTAMGGSGADLDAIDAAAQAEVQLAMQTADAAAWPDPAGAFTDIQTTGDGQWY
jgi:TPP-dependent pyruvate/acetoin dehydrogenase alpha subunit